MQNACLNTHSSSSIGEILMSTIKLYLFSTAYCHLCDQAQQLLVNLGVESFTVIEIIDDTELLSLYGSRIPVLQRNDTKAELNWPFNADDIVIFLRN